MNDLQTILDIIQRPFKQEIKTGCQDKVVVGGFKDYVTNWVEKANEYANPEQKDLLTNLSELFKDYPDIQPDTRQIRLNEATKIIERLCNQQDSESLEQPIPKSEETQKSKIQVERTDIHYDPGREMMLSMPVQNVAGIGTKRAETLAEEVNVRNIGDLLEYYPRDYLDRSRIKQIYQVGRTGEYETIQGVVVNHVEFTPKRVGAKKMSKTVIYDQSGVVSLIAFGKRTQYMASSLKENTKVVVSGKFKRDYGEIQSSEYTYEILSDEDAELIHTGRIVPVYPLTAKLVQRSLRRWIKQIVDEYVSFVPEILPLDIRERYSLIDKPIAVKNIHFPDSQEHLNSARERLAFDELFLLELGLGLKKKNWETEEPGISFKRQSKLLDNFIKSLPFQLTNAQKRVFIEIEANMQSTKPMNRLLQGDVGSGKTVIAAMGMLLAVDNSYQGALMAPTEILAEQHYNTLDRLLTPMGINIVMLRSDMPRREKEDALYQVQTGEANIIVGTHALIQAGVDFASLGLVVTDEQHRFGVMQRAELKKKGTNPDVLVMTATPIPRTLALTVYGDLDVSVIDELPPGRQTIYTRWVSEGKRQEIYKFINDQIAQGRQAYIVYPLVEESEKLEDLKAATEMAEHFQHEVFPHLKVGLIHGRMRADEKQEVMGRMKSNEINILVSTTVIEVGIDIPNASLMLIEHAERFGLAQLHQLRGRVGRSIHKSYCLLIANPKSEDAVQRMKAMVKTYDGFEIAEEDLAIRGPGEFFGIRQSGMPDMKVANIARDVKIIEIARKEAFEIAEKDPTLSKPDHQAMKKVLQEKWRENLEMVSIG
ncbi:MAG: ATP-dependent helicase RecG [Candidatus Poribacteria bacterium]|nr:ATP-dependent helicase RecG [Candidatus Poribacteria bacterium]